LRSAVVGWAVVGISKLLLPGAFVEHFLVLCAVSLTMLWLLHVTTYGARQVMATRSSSRRIREIAAPVVERNPMGRRALIGTFGRALGLAIVASLSLSLPARAQGLPNGSECNYSLNCASGCCDPVSLTCVDQGSHGCCTPTGNVRC
jgi:hypothetical protein